MNVKKYVRYQYKSWIPMLVAAAAIVVSITLIIGLNASPLVSMTWNTETGGDVVPEGVYAYMWNRSMASMIAPMLIPSLILATVLPFFAFGHRYGKTRADCYLCLPSKDGQITRVRVLMLGAFLLVLYLGAYLFGIGAAIIHQLIVIASAKASASYNASIILTTVMGDVGWYFLAWPLGAIVVVIFYAMNCFFVSQGSNVIQGIIALAAGNVLLSGFVPCLLFLVARFNDNASWIDVLGLKGFAFLNAGIHVPFNFFVGVLSGLETRDEYLAYQYMQSWQLWVGISIFVLAGAGAIVYLLLSKEPGGECAGASGPRNTFAVILPHAAFGVGLTALSTLFSVLNGGMNLSSPSSLGLAGILFLTVYAQALGGYYALLSLYNHSFKLDKSNWISFASVASVAFALYPIMSFIPM